MSVQCFQGISMLARSRVASTVRITKEHGFDFYYPRTRWRGSSTYSRTMLRGTHIAARIIVSSPDNAPGRGMGDYYYISRW